MFVNIGSVVFSYYQAYEPRHRSIVLQAIRDTFNSNPPVRHLGTHHAKAVVIAFDLTG